MAEVPSVLSLRSTFGPLDLSSTQARIPFGSENPMKPCLRFLAVTSLFLVTVCAAGQRKAGTPAGYVEFVPIRLTLGMPKDRTVALLSERYDVGPWKGGDIEDSWAVSEKAAPHFIIGTLSFVNGVLIRAARFWDVEDSSYSLAHTISLLMDHLRDEGFTNCTISTRKISSPNDEADVIGINCGQKGIVVQADQVRGKGVQTVQVTENLEATFVPSPH
jgi:hypothetical protein